MFRVLRAALVLLACSAAASPLCAASEKRVALVIGNAAYVHAPQLDNPANDAKDMAATLGKLGFEVIEGINLDETGMRRTVKRFAEMLTGGDVGLFFYAGHGLQSEWAELLGAHRRQVGDSRRSRFRAGAA
jgi:Uncharacterized protein containing caspase domain